MGDALEVGMKLNAWCYDDFYPATVKVISQKKQRTEAPVQVRFEGYGAADDAWLGVEGLKSKRLPKEKDAPKEKAKKDMDFSGLEKGMRVQAEEQVQGARQGALVRLHERIGRMAG